MEEEGVYEEYGQYEEHYGGQQENMDVNMEQGQASQAVKGEIL